jgi:hypothetical protein
VIPEAALNAAEDPEKPLDTRRGYQLLILLRSYMELDMYASLRNHTESTISDGRAELRTWERELEVSNCHSQLDGSTDT